MRNIKHNYRAWIIRVDNSIAENQRNENILNIPSNRGNREDTDETAVGSNMNASEITQRIPRPLPERRTLTSDEMWGETARATQRGWNHNFSGNDLIGNYGRFQPWEPPDNDWRYTRLFLQQKQQQQQQQLARGIGQYGLFNIPPLP